MADRKRVLAVIYADGRTDIYADEGVDVQTVTPPVGCEPHDTLTEEWIEAEVPQSYRELLRMPRLQGGGYPSKLTRLDWCFGEMESWLWCKLKELKTGKV